MSTTGTLSTEALCDRLCELRPDAGLCRIRESMDLDYEGRVAALVNGIGAARFLAVVEEIERREQNAYCHYCGSRVVTGSRSYIPGSVASIDRGSWSMGPSPKLQSLWLRMGALLALLRPHVERCRAALAAI